MATDTIENLKPSSETFDSDVLTKHSKLDLGSRIAMYMARDSVNKIDSQFFNNIDNAKDPILKEIVENSNFHTERQQAGHMLVDYGEIFALWVQVNDKWYIQFLKVINYTCFKREIKSIIASKFNKFINGKECDSMYYNFKIDEDGTVVGRAYIPGDGKDTDDQFMSENDIKYNQKLNFIPGAIIQNNYNSEPDIFPIMEILQELNVLSCDLGEEWERVKTMFANQSSLTNKGKNSAQIKKSILGGEFVFDSSSYNSRFSGLPITPFISGSTSLDNLVRAIVFLEDRVMKYSFYGRDFEGSATNKHNLQISLFAQASGEYIQTKKEQRQRDYLYFFNLAYKLEIIKEPIKSITIYDSIFERGKIEGLKITEAQKDLYKAQAKNQKTQAKEKNIKSKNNKPSSEEIIDNS